jgi:predicted DNA-binding transcriptional regulator AlpA
MNGQPIETLLDEKELSRWLRVSVGTLRFWRVVDRGPRYRKVGQLVRYSRPDVQAWLDSRPVGGEEIGEGGNRV